MSARPAAEVPQELSPASASAAEAERAAAVRTPVLQVPGAPTSIASTVVEEARAAATLLLHSTGRWLWINLDWFHPAHWARYLPARRFDAQPALELLLLTRRLGGRTRLTEPALRVAAAVVDRQVVGGYFERPDEMLRYWVFLLALLHSGGYPRPELVELAGAALEARFPDPRGLLPVERQELRYCLDLAGVPTAMPTHVELADAALDDLLTRADDLSTVDAYALTHLVLYAADLGAAPLPLDPEPVRRLVRAQLEVQVAIGDHDLTAELVHCARIAGIREDPLVLRGLRALLAAQHEDGAVPSPPFDAAIHERLRGGELAGYRFAARYHTTLVTAMAAADHLARQ